MSEEIELLTPVQHVQIRPAMYVGSVVSTEGIIPSYNDGRIEFKELQYVPASIRCFCEYQENSIDAFIKSKTRTPKLNIIYHSDDSITIKDNGPGIPITMHSSGKPTPEVVLCELASGSNFKSNKDVGLQGQNGVGAACATFLSDYVDVTIHREGKVYRQLFTEGSVKKNPPSITTSQSKKETGTSIRFKLNQHILPLIPKEYVRNKAIDIASAYPNLTIDYVDEHTKERMSIKGNFDEQIKNERYFKFTTDNIDMYILFDRAETEYCYSWINGCYLFDGGICNKHAIDKLTSAVETHFETLCKKQKVKIVKDDIFSSLVILLRANVSDPMYDSQAKIRFKGPSFKSSLDNMIDEQWSSFSRKHKEDLQQIFEHCLSRSNKVATKQVEKKASKPIFIPGFIDATSSDRQNCWLLLTEGLSASSQISAARDPATIATLPLSGKINNVFDATPAQLLQMPKITQMLSVIGLVPGKPAVRENLNYGHVVIATDADPDGDSIFVLLVNIFFQFWPELMAPSKDPFLYRMCAPNIVVVKNNTRTHFATKALYESKKQSITGKYHIEYMKGLGSMTVTDWEMCLHDKKTFMPIIDDGQIKSLLNMFFSGDSEQRKEWLSK